MNRIKTLVHDCVLCCRSMSGAYSLFRLCAKQWTKAMLFLISLTIVFGLIGFNDGKYDYLARPYLVVLLFPLNNGEVSGNVENWAVEIARWLGVLVWSSTVITVLVKLFANRVLELFVRFAANDHTIVAGLGRHGHELVERLLKVKEDGKWENVIVISRDATNAQLDACRDKGAVVLIGDPASDRLLDTACLKKAKRLLVLFGEDQETLQVVTEAYRLLQPSDEGENIPKQKVYCVATVTDPGLQEVINQHDLKRNEADFFSINSINLYEICSRSMLSQARWHSKTGELRQIAIMGLGKNSRLAETLILRTAKDQLIDSSPPIEIHLYDLESVRFARELVARFPFLMKARTYFKTCEC